MNTYWNYWRDLFWNFMLEPASAAPLAALRVALSGTLLLQAFLMRTTLLDLFSTSGFIQGSLASKLSDQSLPRISHLTSVLGQYGIDETFCIFFVCLSLVASLVLLLLGWHTRTAALIAWLTHWTLMNTADATTYGVDQFAHVFLFYLIWVPSGSIWSVDARAPGAPPSVSSGARIGLRLLQLHLCIAYLASGLAKAQGIQ